MTYSVKETFYTLQGEGAQAGMPAVFCRFAGCNLWSGREADRASAICQFCDTDFVGTDDAIGGLGGRFQSAQALAHHIALQWPQHDDATQGHRLVVLTGGEPLLQVDTALIDALHAQHFRIAVETNGSLPAPEGIDWLCVSPKAGAPWVQQQGHELKVVWPQTGFDLADLVQTGQFANRFLQPLDPSALPSQPKGLPAIDSLKLCIDQCLQDPRWRLSMQTHKISGIR
jgi:7-carboxy-7-deazaguanine synthase